jgi:hypothetical protein
LKKLEVLQKRMATVLTFWISRDSSIPIFDKLKSFKLIDFITINSTKFISNPYPIHIQFIFNSYSIHIQFIFKAINGMWCEVTNGLFSYLPKRRTRSHNEFYLREQNWKIQYLRNSLFYKGIELWNELPTKNDVG